MAESFEKKIDVNGKMLYVEFFHQYKNRPTIVFLHDSLGCVQLWRDFPVKLSLATECNILIYDRLGYGKSDPMLSSKRTLYYLEEEAEILNDLLSILDIREAILFGHSDGGSIALLTAAKYPDNIKALICEAAHIFVEEVTLKGIYDALDAYDNTDLPQRLEKYHGEKVDTIFKAWVETWMSDDFRKWNIESYLSDIISPLLFIQGEADEYGTLAQVDRTVSQVGGIAEKIILPDVGHTPHKQLSEKTIKISADFLKSIL
ncbi:alpha/beta fold hydrolase [Chryseobacterium caseinilyticum]|uniref:Alpha/beta hydrolase n=1 Tax=Chryseobacterium caseinilyticum TaxID=2771428 RepID=A0ABR8ZBX8_9FLAO|nr:alpha/beta hydrolase [Chryseobacterium caseinilyticum]MBD8082824.1 alpha/beta hydrolase [Chryseobacterium caseinilyticum]